MSTFEQILHDIQDQEKARAIAMPTEEAALHQMRDVFLRLKELGWTEAQYCPKDGKTCLFIEFGSSHVFHGHYSGEWPNGVFLLEDQGDLYPSRPVLFRPLPPGIRPDAVLDGDNHHG